jgi:hypothetical protein
MPTFLALCCAFCHKYQVQQDKKVKKFTCPCCHQQQSYQRIYAISDKAKDIRLVVQDLNERHITAAETQDHIQVQSSLDIAPLKQYDPSLWQEFIEEESDKPEQQNTTSRDMYVTEAPDLPRPAKRLKQQKETSTAASRPHAVPEGWHKEPLRASRLPGQRLQHQNKHEQLQQEQPKAHTWAIPSGTKRLPSECQLLQSGACKLGFRLQMEQQQHQQQVLALSIPHAQAAGAASWPLQATRSTSSWSGSEELGSRWGVGPSSEGSANILKSAQAMPGDLPLRDCSKQQHKAKSSPLAAQLASKQPEAMFSQQGAQQQQQLRKQQQPQHMSTWGMFMEAETDAGLESDEGEELDARGMLVTTID